MGVRVQSIKAYMGKESPTLLVSDELIEQSISIFKNKEIKTEEVTIETKDLVRLMRGMYTSPIPVTIESNMVANDTVIIPVPVIKDWKIVSVTWIPLTEKEGFVFTKYRKNRSKYAIITIYNEEMTVFSLINITNIKTVNLPIPMKVHDIATNLLKMFKITFNNHPFKPILIATGLNISAYPHTTTNKGSFITIQLTTGIPKITINTYIESLIGMEPDEAEKFINMLIDEGELTFSTLNILLKLINFKLSEDKEEDSPPSLTVSMFIHKNMSGSIMVSYDNIQTYKEYPNIIKALKELDVEDLLI